MALSLNCNIRRHTKDGDYYDDVSFALEVLRPDKEHQDRQGISLTCMTPDRTHWHIKVERDTSTSAGNANICNKRDLPPAIKPNHQNNMSEWVLLKLELSVSQN